MKIRMLATCASTGARWVCVSKSTGPHDKIWDEDGPSARLFPSTFSNMNTAAVMISTTQSVTQMIKLFSIVTNFITLNGNKLPPVVREQNPTGPAVTLCLLSGKAGRGPRCLCSAVGNFCSTKVWVKMPTNAVLRLSSCQSRCMWQADGCSQLGNMCCPGGSFYDARGSS